MGVNYNHKISELAHFFKNADPRVYEKFIAILTECSQELTVAVTTVPMEQILEARGRAQQARKFLQLFVETREPNRPT